MTDKEKIRKEVARLYRESYDNAPTVLHQLMDFINSLPEEPVNEDLEEAAENAIEDLEQKLTNVTLDEVVRNWLRCMFRAGALWQKEVFEKNRLAHCDAQTEEEAEIEQSFVMGIIENKHRQPTFDDAIKYGMRLQKKKMMEEAIDVEVKVDAGGYPYVDKTIELYDYDKDIPLAKMEDKYKVVLIKEG